MRLTHLRKDAGLTGKELSARCGRHPAKTTRIQKGDAPPSDTGIRTWCAACGADDQADDLIATARAVDSMYLERRRPHRTGMRKVQQEGNTLHERTRLCRVHVSNVPPGFFQTPPFATALMEQITAFQGTPNDVAEAVAARIARSRFLYEDGHRYVVLMEESAAVTVSRRRCLSPRLLPRAPRRLRCRCWTRCRRCRRFCARCVVISQRRSGRVLPRGRMRHARTTSSANGRPPGAITCGRPIMSRHRCWSMPTVTWCARG